MELIFEISKSGRSTIAVQQSDVPAINIEKGIGKKYLRTELDLPEVAEVDLVRHYTNLSRRNFGVDLGFYPLGSCTMKYNPKVNENAAALPGFTSLHPYAADAMAQGNLQLMFEMQKYLSEIFGMAEFTLQPAAGAHGELTGVMMIKKYFEKKGEKRHIVLIPDTAHGTNPASGALCGFETVTLNSNSDGGVDIEHLKSLMTKDVAALMLTNPTRWVCLSAILKKSRASCTIKAACFMAMALMPMHSWVSPAQVISVLTSFSLICTKHFPHHTAAAAPAAARWAWAKRW
jgi:glycine dehydrogenase subunit 2